MKPRTCQTRTLDNWPKHKAKRRQRRYNHKRRHQRVNR